MDAPVRFLARGTAEPRLITRERTAGRYSGYFHRRSFSKGTLSVGGSYRYLPVVRFNPPVLMPVVGAPRGAKLSYHAETECN